MPACKEAVELLVDFVEGHISPAIAARLHEHFDRCPPCLRLLETYRKTSAICRDSLRESVPPGLCDKILAALRAQRDK